MSYLTSEQRYTINVLLEQSFSKSEIALFIKKDKSVVTRELKRNCDLRSGKYDFDFAQRKYEKRQKGKSKRNDLTVEIKARIKEYLHQELSPEQIVGICSKNGLSCVSIECIYRHIWKDIKEEGNLYLSLRTTGKRYRKRGSAKDSRGVLSNRR